MLHLAYWGIELAMLIAVSYYAIREFRHLDQVREDDGGFAGSPEVARSGGIA